MRQIRDLMAPRLLGFFQGIPFYGVGMMSAASGPHYVYDHEGD
jgi:hypothetical protein